MFEIKGDTEKTCKNNMIFKSIFEITLKNKKRCIKIDIS